ncbi:MAG: hypothetical protein ABJB74_14145 [Gemmatimonas sp.]
MSTLLKASMVALALTVGARATAASEVEAQATVVRSTSTTPCSGCRLQIDSVTTVTYGEQLGARGGAMVNGVGVSPNREIVITGQNQLPEVFDFSGRFLRTVGTKGREWRHDSKYWQL